MLGFSSESTRLVSVVPSLIFTPSRNTLYPAISLSSSVDSDQDTVIWFSLSEAAVTPARMEGGVTSGHSEVVALTIAISDMFPLKSNAFIQ